MFQDDAPLLVCLLSFRRSAPNVLQLLCDEVLQHILLVAKNLETTNPFPTNYQEFEGDSLYQTDELQETGVYFPNHPVVRKVSKTIFSSSEMNANCTKNYHVGGGIILFWCARHKLCIGFVLLETAESCEYVYTTLVSRFSKIPKVINLS
jgi:hypothetical protein